MRLSVLLVGLIACKGGGDTADTDVTSGPVVINELVVGNMTGLTDEFGEYPDWIELYNTTGATVDLAGWTLNDEVGVRAPWPLPVGTTIAGHGYVVVFCDNQPDQGAMHATFKLSRLGEDVQLLTADGSVADDVAFPAQPVDDLGYGRVPDGSANWATTDPPTPNAAN